jgi:hypothetical protein
MVALIERIAPSTGALTVYFASKARDAAAPFARVLVSAATLFPKELDAFTKGGASAKLRLPLAAGADLPGKEGRRELTNVAICFLGEALPELHGRLANERTASTSFTTVGHLAHSNHVPAGSPLAAPAADLDPLAMGPPDQTWTLVLPATANSHLDRRKITDVILGLEYRTTVAWVGA